jgi:hypothetical protein
MNRNWVTTIAIALVPALGPACGQHDAHAAQPAKPSTPKPPSQPAPPPPDANAASRRPVEPKVAETPPSSPSPLEVPPTEAPTAADEEPLLSDEDAAIPTQEEADQEAALSITEENADQELEKLEKELAEGGGG